MPNVGPQQVGWAVRGWRVDAAARVAPNNYMRSKEHFLETFIDPHNLDSIDAYIDVLASTPDDAAPEACPNKAARLAEARALRVLSAGVNTRDQATLEAAIPTARELIAGQGAPTLARFLNDVAVPLLDLVTLENDHHDRPDELRIYVVSRATIKAMHASSDTPRLKVFQDLRKSNQLTTLRVTKQEVLGGALRNKHKVLAISYPWQGFGDPDSTNDRLDTVVAYLEEERPDIEYVWWDFLLSLIHI